MAFSGKAVPTPNTSGHPQPNTVRTASPPPCAASRPLRPSPGLWRGGHCLAASSWRLCLVLRPSPALGQSSRPAGSPKPGRPSTLSADGPQCWSCEPALGWRAGRVSSLRRSGLWRGHRRGSRATVSRPHACVRSFNARARVRLNPASSCPGASALVSGPAVLRRLDLQTFLNYLVG